MLIFFFNSINFNLVYINKIKDIENVIYSEEFIGEGKDDKNKNIHEFIKSIENLNSVLIELKDNYCIIKNKESSFKFSFPFISESFIPKDKRKIVVGVIAESQNMDLILEYHNWNCNFYGGEIYNENSNLILINYDPPWPHNFIFNQNVIKTYNEIFNLIFPLKTSLTMLNSLWVDKKTICKHYSSLFKVIDSIHTELHTFLQNLISFYMFDVIEVNFNIFLEKLKNCNDLEELMKIHEEFLNVVSINSFVKSKRIMRIIFNILFVIRKFYNYVRNILNKIQISNLINEKDSTLIEEENNFRSYLFNLKEEFKIKVDYFKDLLDKIKNTKHHKIVSQILSKLN